MGKEKRLADCNGQPFCFPTLLAIGAIGAAMGINPGGRGARPSIPLALSSSLSRTRGLCGVFRRENVPTQIARARPTCGHGDRDRLGPQPTLAERRRERRRAER